MGRKISKSRLKAQKSARHTESQNPISKDSIGNANIKVALGLSEEDGYQPQQSGDSGTNALVLSAKGEKRKRKNSEESKPGVKRLSKKRRKQLEKVIERREKKSKVKCES